MSPTPVPGGAAGSVKNNGDQRSHRRYPVDLEVHYKLLKQRRVVCVGTGRIFNVSQGGVFFKADEVLPVDSLVELSVTWPSGVEEPWPTKLLISGRIVRSEARGAAIQTEHYEYRTSGPRPVEGVVPKNEVQSFVA